MIGAFLKARASSLERLKSPKDVVPAPSRAKRDRRAPSLPFHPTSRCPIWCPPSVHLRFNCAPSRLHLSDFSRPPLPTHSPFPSYLAPSHHTPPPRKVPWPQHHALPCLSLLTYRYSFFLPPKFSTLTPLSSPSYIFTLSTIFPSLHRPPPIIVPRIMPKPNLSRRARLYDTL